MSARFRASARVAVVAIGRRRTSRRQSRGTTRSRLAARSKEKKEPTRSFEALEDALEDAPRARRFRFSISFSAERRRVTKPTKLGVKAGGSYPREGSGSRFSAAGRERDRSRREDSIAASLDRARRWGPRGTYPVLVEAQEFDVAADGLPRADGGHHDNFLAIDELEGFVLRNSVPPGLSAAMSGRVAANWIVTALPTISSGPRSGASAHDVRRGPAHDPQAVNQSLRGERTELLEQLVADLHRGGGGLWPWRGRHVA